MLIEKTDADDQLIDALKAEVDRLRNQVKASAEALREQQQEAAAAAKQKRQIASMAAGGKLTQVSAQDMDDAAAQREIQRLRRVCEQQVTN